MIDLEPGGAFELVLGLAIFVRIDCVLARLVITARLDTDDLVIRFEFADLFDEDVVDRPLAFRRRQVGAWESHAGNAFEQIRDVECVNAGPALHARIVDDPVPLNDTARMELMENKLRRMAAQPSTVEFRTLGVDFRRPLPLPACGERGPLHEAQTRGEAPSPGICAKSAQIPASPRKRGEVTPS